MNRLSISYGSAYRRATINGSPTLWQSRKGHRTEMGSHLHAIIFDPLDKGIVGVAQPRGTLGDGVQHRLNVRRRAGDHAKDLARGGLLLQRFGEFLEQPDVLDGDHGLVGKGFQQFDLRRA